MLANPIILRLAAIGMALALPLTPAHAFDPAAVTIERFDLPAGARPHDVAPALDGRVWYTAQRQGALGWLDPASGEVVQIPLGPESAPHGVIVGPDGAPWVTDGGQNAIVRVDPLTRAVTVYPLPADSGYANLNTAAFDGNGVLWFTGQSGIYGRLDPLDPLVAADSVVEVWPAPGGRGPYGIAATPNGDIYYASLAGSHIAQIDTATGAATPIAPPTADQGARRVWSDSGGRIWVSEWISGQLSRHDPASGDWRTWPLPGAGPRAYAVYVDETDAVWVSDFGGNAVHRFDPILETFATFDSDRGDANVRQILGRPGEIWLPESGVDRLVVIRWQ